MRIKVAASDWVKVLIRRTSFLHVSTGGTKIHYLLHLIPNSTRETCPVGRMYAVLSGAQCPMPNDRRRAKTLLVNNACRSEHTHHTIDPP